MKKVLVLLMVVCMVFGLAACGKSAKESIAEKIEDKIAEEVAEELVEKAIENIGEVEDITIDADKDGKIVVSDGENTLVVEGNEEGMPWPSDKLPSSVPELKDVLVVSVADSAGMILIGFEECTGEQALAYKDEIVEAGWNVLMDMSQDDGGMLTTSNEDGEALMFVWDTEEGGGAVTYTPAQ